METVNKRYLYKFGAGFFSVASLGVIQAIALRALGPSVYGTFDFMNTFYIQAVTFLDLGTADCFYNKLSKRPGESGLVVFYMGFVIVASAALLVLTLMAVISPLAPHLWPGISKRFIIMGAALGIFTWMASGLNKSVDAYGLTIEAEVWRVIQKLLGVTLLSALVWFNRLTLTAFFGYWNFLMIFLICAFLWVNARGGYPLPQRLALSPEARRGYASEFYAYSHPMFTHAAVTFATAVLGRWLLQRFSGSAEQALFGISEQISSMCALGVRVMAPLLLREFSIAHHHGDRARMAELFRTHVPVLHSVTVYFACFTALHAETVVRLLGGGAYARAETAATLMSLAAIPQGGALMFGSILLASDRTDLYRNVGISAMIGGAILNYGLLAPASAGGMHLGSVGLAAQTLAVQFALFAVFLALAARSLDLSFLRHFGRLLACLGGLLAAASLSRWLSGLLTGAGMPLPAAFLIAGASYTGAALLLAGAAPAAFGLERGQLAGLCKKLMQIVKINHA